MPVYLLLKSCYPKETGPNERIAKPLKSQKTDFMQITKSQLITRIFLVLGILVLVNIIAAEYHYRLDFTADQRYTLSKATKKILRNTDKPVTVNAYFSKDLPARVAKAKRHFKDLLIEYRNHAEQDFVFKFINPNKDKESERKAQKKGIKPFVLGTRKRDQVQRQRAYMGAVIQIGNQSEVISRIKPEGPVEYKLSSNIHKLTQSDKPTIAIFKGQGGISKNNLGQALKDLKVLYNVESYELKASEPIPSKFRTGIIVNPKDSFSEGVLKRLDDFLASGSNLFVATDYIDAKVNEQRLSLLHTGLEDWLENKGIEIKENVLIDAQCGAVQVRRQIRGRAINQRIKFPYFPIVQKFEEHPVTKGVSQLFLPFSGTVDSGKNKSLNFNILARSSKKSGTLTIPNSINVNKEWRESDFPGSYLPVALSAEGHFGGTENVSRMVVVASDNLIQKQDKQQTRRNRRNRVREGNANFLVNAVDWLSDQMGLAELRTQGVDARPLEDLSDQNKNLLKYANAFAPIILILVVGGIRFQIQQSKRKRWMS